VRQQTLQNGFAAAAAEVHNLQQCCAALSAADSASDTCDDHLKGVALLLLLLVLQ